MRVDVRRSNRRARETSAGGGVLTEAGLWALGKDDVAMAVRMASRSAA